MQSPYYQVELFSFSITKILEGDGLCPKLDVEFLFREFMINCK